MELKVHGIYNKGMERSMRLHEIVPLTHANGPGARACIWVQGCSLACPGCFNPETHDFGTGLLRSVASIAEEICSLAGIEGVTISGGEPLQQPDALIGLLSLIREHGNLSVIIFSGFDKKELEKMPCLGELRQLVDAIVTGRYVEEKRLAEGLLGSSNQEILLFSERYSLNDFKPIPPAEVIINADGTITLSGVDPIKL